jgi:predicted O-methyltransferase YrrM
MSTIDRFLQKLVHPFFTSAPGRRMFGHAARVHPELLLEPLGYTLSRNARLSQVRVWPTELETFADVAPLVLSSNAANRGVASMSLEEIAHLWRLAATVDSGTIVEIGRERGGSTLVLAAAMGRGVTLYSFDPQRKHPKLGPTFDNELVDVLRRYRLAERVRLVREDSHVAEIPPGEYALVLVDGDPTLDGTRSDFKRFCRRLRPGGHALFHDAGVGGPRHVNLKPLVVEIEAETEFERLRDVGTFVHFVRRVALTSGGGSALAPEGPRKT